MTTRRPHPLARRAAAIVGNDDTLLEAAQARLGERVHAAVILDVGAGTLHALLPRRRAEQLLLAVTDDDVYLLACRRRTLAPMLGAVRHRVARESLIATWQRQRLAITAELSCPDQQLHIVATTRPGPSADRVIGLLMNSELERYE
jgi:hypothetical protein